MVLVDKADLGAAQQSPPLVAEAAAITAADQHRAAVRTLQQAGDMQHGRLPGAGRPNQWNDLARPQREVNAVQHDELGLGPA
jgi:hypothetical protein